MMGREDGLAALDAHISESRYGIAGAEIDDGC
jgi:hypothetical protein